MHLFAPLLPKLSLVCFVSSAVWRGASSLEDSIDTTQAFYLSSSLAWSCSISSTAKPRPFSPASLLLRFHTILLICREFPKHLEQQSGHALRALRCFTVNCHRWSRRCNPPSLILTARSVQVSSLSVFPLLPHHMYVVPLRLEPSPTVLDHHWPISSDHGASFTSLTRCADKTGKFSQDPISSMACHSTNPEPTDVPCALLVFELAMPSGQKEWMDFNQL